MKSIVKIVHLPSVVNCKFTKLREYFCMPKKTKIMTLFNNSSPPCHRSAILENIHWTQTAYAVLCQPHHTNTSTTFIYALIWMKTAYPCVADDTEQHTKSILVASENYSWTTDGRWTILAMSFILFWALTVLIVWQSMGTVISLPVFIQNN